MLMTILCHSAALTDIRISTLEAESQVLIDWFKDIKMQANPDEFQVLAVGKTIFAKNPSIQIQNNILSCEETVKLLGIDIDYQLKIFQHISNLCRKASQQLGNDHLT